MVGEISPDGNFIWNGTEWVPHDNIEEVQNVFQPTTDVQEQGFDWEPVSDKIDENGKGKIVGMSIVGLLILTAISWAVYAFVIDPMLFPDELERAEFIEMVKNEPSKDDVVSGEIDYWTCDIELEASQEMDGTSITIGADYSIYASKDSARIKSEMATLFSPFGNDIWMDENIMAWNIIDGESGKVAIESMSGSPVGEFMNGSSTPVELCFIHQEIATTLENDSSKSFSSEGERFPDKKGVRAVKVEVEHVIENDDGSEELWTVGVYFDDGGDLLGTKLTNASTDVVVQFGSDSFSKPGWVSDANSDVPLPISIESSSSIWSVEQNRSVSTLFNATYSMEDAKVVLYTSEYDYENSVDIIEIVYEVDLFTAINGGGVIQDTDEWYGENNCTLSYVDNLPLNEISTGDILSISCDNYAMSDYDIGIANENGLAVEMDLEVPWISPIFTIFTLLGAALLTSRRKC